MQVYRTIADLIDLRSFSNLWFWITIALAWSQASHFVLGVPYDMVLRARRHGGEAERDLELLAAVQMRRRLFIARRSGVSLLAIVSAVMTALAMLGFYYGIEFAQALFLLLAPLAAVSAWGLRRAARIARDAQQGPALWRELSRHRLATQAVGFVAIFVTAMWGMYHNLHLPLLPH